MVGCAEDCGSSPESPLLNVLIGYDCGGFYCCEEQPPDPPPIGEPDGHGDIQSQLYPSMEGVVLTTGSPTFVGAVVPCRAIHRDDNIYGGKVSIQLAFVYTCASDNAQLVGSFDYLNSSGAVVANLTQASNLYETDDPLDNQVTAADGSGGTLPDDMSSVVAVRATVSMSPDYSQGPISLASCVLATGAQCVC